MKKEIFLSLSAVMLLANPPYPPFFRNNPVQVRQSNKKGVELDDVRTLRELSKSLSKIESMLEQKKIIEKEKEEEKRKKEEEEEKKRRKELEKAQKKVEYEQSLFEINKQKKMIEKMKYKNSKEYLRTLIALLKKRIEIAEEEIRNYKPSKETVIRVYDVYEVGGEKSADVSLKALSNAVSYLKTKERLYKSLKTRIERIRKYLSLLNENVLYADSNRYKIEIESIIDVLKPINNTLSEIVSDEDRINAGDTALTPSVTVLSVYKEPKKEESVRIEEGDMLTPGIQVKKIVKNYAVIGFVK